MLPLAPPAVFPHDDYWDDDFRPWWQRSRPDAEAMRRERQALGILPPDPDPVAEAAAAAEALAEEERRARLDAKLRARFTAKSVDFFPEYAARKDDAIPDEVLMLAASGLHIDLPAVAGREQALARRRRKTHHAFRARLPPKSVAVDPEYDIPDEVLMLAAVALD